MQAPQPLQACISISGWDTLPIVSGKRIARGSQASSQLRHMTPNWVKHRSPTRALCVQPGCVIFAAWLNKPASQCLVQSPQKVHSPPEKSTRGKPPSPATSIPCGHCSMHLLQRVHSSVNWSGAISQGGRNSRRSGVRRINRRLLISIGIRRLKNRPWRPHNQLRDPHREPVTPYYRNS